jgi:hypothetical protein
LLSSGMLWSMDLPDDMSESERRLVASVRQEMVVDFRTGDACGPDEAEQWGEDRRVRAAVIVALVSGAESLRRFTLCGVRICGDLDLANVRLQASLLFEHCVSEFDRLIARAARVHTTLSGLTFRWR